MVLRVKLEPLLEVVSLYVKGAQQGGLGECEPECWPLGTECP